MSGDPGSSPSDPPTSAGLSRTHLLELFQALVRTRGAEERLEQLFHQGHISGGLYRSLGQEAGAVGLAYALRRRSDGTGDIVAQTIRATGAVFLMGGRPVDFFRQYLARGTGPTRGREANVHWSDFRRGLLGPVSPLGSMVEVMAGITLAFRMKGEDRVGAVFGGDGASSTGAWHEGLNLAAVQRCPMVLAVEANQWAFSTPTTKQTRVASFLEKCEGYGITGVSVDGTDVLAVYQAARGAVERARGGGGVQMVELRYYRRRGHAQHDAQEYVDPEELRTWEARDPLDGFRSRLISEGWAGEEELTAIEARIEEELAAAASQALGEPRPDPEEARLGIWTDVQLPEPWYRTPGGKPGGPSVIANDPRAPVVDPFRMEGEDMDTQGEREEA
jgi:TPP-dependent pyruvate/acetoin dehydrogenase alpha subunit